MSFDDCKIEQNLIENGNIIYSFHNNLPIRITTENQHCLVSIIGKVDIVVYKNCFVVEKCRIKGL